jgi:DNA polymerase I-like protein with 3'-5' exonuclease and polymerase domains
MKSSNIWYVLDFETSNQNMYACEIDRVCVGMFDINKGKLIGSDDYNFRKKRDLGGLRQAMRSPNPKVAHNAGFELHLLERLGVPVKGVMHDTYMMAKHWRNDLPAYDLKSLSWWIFGDLYTPLSRLKQWICDHNMEGEDDIEFDMTKPPDRLVHNYCMHDIKMTAKLATHFYPMVKDCYPYQLDIELIPHVVDAETSGMMADREFYEKFVEEGNAYVDARMKIATKELKLEGTGKKPTGNALRDHLKSRGEKRKTKTGMTKADAVIFRDHMDSKAVVAVAELKSKQKEVNTYAVNILKAINERNIFHPNLHQSAASTRRFISSKLYSDLGIIAKGQVQNFPRGEGIRTGIVVPEGFGFQKSDLASIEARLGASLMAELLSERWFLEQYCKDDAFNIYIHVGSDCEGRSLSKKEDIYSAYKHGVLGIQYGVGDDTFYETLHDKFGLPYTLDDCIDIRKNIHKNYPMFGQLQNAAKAVVEGQGYITDNFGDVYYTPLNRIYKAVNDYCQGCAGNVLKWWWNEWVKTEEYQGSPDYIFNTVHDELDCAMYMDGEEEHRTQAYCDVLKPLEEIFGLPIIAEVSDYVPNWGLAG